MGDEDCFKARLRLERSTLKSFQEGSNVVTMMQSGEAGRLDSEEAGGVRLAAWRRLLNLCSPPCVVYSLLQRLFQDY